MLNPTALLLACADGSPAPTAFHSSALSANDPFARERKVAWHGDDGIAAGIVQASGTFVVDAYPYAEMLVVHAGFVTVQSETGSLELAAGSSAVIGRGTAVQIQALAGSLWAFCANTAASENQPGLTALDPRALLQPSAAPEPAILIGHTPQCRAQGVYEDSNELRIGVWDSTPYRRHGRPHKLHELMHLVEGSVTLQAPDGSGLVVNPGDTVFVPKGADVAWISTVYVRKYYAVI
ncbi:cupin domain-containing protein [Pseudomonas abieticivorans]|uniref:cupin domain-containing protein n=1 Tax=Pseudomonas abieticivorans TaxID=2931382 RepID=UPI0020BF638E|nr:cupin domain-containing protein [Pseudomonas sp. PIA16]